MKGCIKQINRIKERSVSRKEDMLVTERKIVVIFLKGQRQTSISLSRQTD